jgi:hypothetical protein
LDFEEPNSYWSVDSRFIFFLGRNYKIFDKIFNLYPIKYPRNFESKFDKILKICPCTVDYINKNIVKQKIYKCNLYRHNLW